MLTPTAVTKNCALVIDADAGPLTRIQAIEALTIHLFAFEAMLIEEWRRTTGATWQDVATATGAGSKQAAQQRWGEYMD